MSKQIIEALLFSITNGLDNEQCVYYDSKSEYDALILNSN